MRAFWPTGLVLGVIFLAALALGADRPAASLSFSAVLLLLTGVLFLLRPGSLSGVGMAWVVGAVGLFVIGLVNGRHSTGAGEYASLLAGAGVFLAARGAAMDKRRSEALWLAAVVIGGLLAFAVFVDFIIDPRQIFWLDHPYGGGARLSAPFLSANTAATFFGVIGLMAVALLLRAVSRNDRASQMLEAGALPMAVLLVSGTCVFLTGSRAGITAFSLAAIGLFLWDGLSHVKAGSGQLKSAFGGATTVLVIGLVVFGLSGSVYSDRLLQAGHGLSESVRGILLDRYLVGIWCAPWLGSGLGGFEFINDFLATAADAHEVTFQNAAHNVAFQWIFQAGFIGAAAALGVLVWLLRSITLGLSRRRSQHLYLRTGLVISGFVFAHGMVDYALEIPAFMWLFSFVLGLSAGVAAGGSRSQTVRGPVASVAKWIVVGVLFSGGALSAYAAFDRSAAVNALALDDQRFLEIYKSDKPLAGSPVLLEAVGDRALRLDTPDYGLASTAFRTSLEGEPRSGKIWAKLAHSNYMIIPVIAGETEEALRQSYYFMPYADRDFVRWRLAFMAEIWPLLPADLREAAARETRMLSERERVRWLTSVGVEPNAP